MHAAQKGAQEHDEFKILHILIRLRWIGPVVEHERNARRNQHDEEKEGDESQVEGVLEPQVLRFYLRGMDMQPDVQEDKFGLALVSGQWVAPNDRMPDFADKIHCYTISL